MIKSISKMAIAVMVLAVLAAFALPASASGNPGAGCAAETKFYNSTIQGSVNLEQKGWLQNSPMTQTFENVPSGIKIARVYTGVWGGSPGKGGFFNITIQNATGSHTTATYKACDPCPVAPCADYQSLRCDALNWSGNSPPNVPSGDIRDYIAGCGVHFISFNATPYITPGTNTITVKTAGGAGCTQWDGRIYLIALLVVYENASMPDTTYWINEGAPYLEKGSDCDGPDDHLYASKYFNGTNISNPARVKLWSLGWPRVINATVPPDAYTNLNGNNIGYPDITESGGYSNEALLRWNNVPAVLNNVSNLLEYYDPEPYYERSYVEVLMVEGPPNLPDLTVTDIGFPTVMRPDTNYTITAKVENLGKNSTAFNVSLYVNGSFYAKNTSISSLAAGASTEVSFTNVNLGNGCYNFKVVADSDNNVTETVEYNNERTEKYQVGNVIVVRSNSGFDNLVSEGLATNESGTYYIKDLTITNCAGNGIHIKNTSVPFVIRNCTVHNCADHGIVIEDAKNGKINESEVYGSGTKGIRMRNSSYMLVDNNYVHDNTESYGIDVYMKTMPYLDSHNITISNNTIAGNFYGIELMGHNCTIRDNVILNSTMFGIYVAGNSSKVYNNTIKYSVNYGLKLALTAVPCFWNYLYWNDIIGNNGGGVQAYDDGINYWNTSTKVNYCYSGTTYNNYTGNYWSNYIGGDSNSDGIGDTPYALDGGKGAKDSYPMILPWWGDTFNIPIYGGRNLIAIPLIQDDPTLNAVFDIGVNSDVVRKYVNSEEKYHSAEYFDGYGWYEYEVVEPIEPEAGYVYERAGAGCTLTIIGTRCTGTISTPIFNGMNLVGYLNFTSTDLSTFNSPVNSDVVRRYVNSEEKYHSAEYFDGDGWYEYEVVNPIEVGVGYYYERAGSDYVWTYEV